MFFKLFVFLIIVTAVGSSDDFKDPDELRYLCTRSDYFSRAYWVCRPKFVNCAFFGPTYIEDRACLCGMTDHLLETYCCPNWSNETEDVNLQDAMTALVRTYDNAVDESDIPKSHCGKAINENIKRVCRKTTPRCEEIGPADFKKRICGCGLTDNEIARYCCPNELQRAEELTAAASGIPWY